MAETFTEKLKLSKRDTGDLNWGAGANANLDLLDSHAQQGNLRPPRTLLASLGSGAVGAELVGSATYFYKITSINPSGETKENQVPSVLEAQVTEPATPVPIILQWETVKGASGYRIYKSTTTGQEKFLAEVAGEATANYTDTGNTPVNAGISVPTTNTALTALSGLRKTGEAAFLRGDVELDAGPNITLTQDGPNKKITIEAAGGGGSYVTALVDAPTGVAATDTSNIQTALNAAGTAGGGIVQLREGTYVISTTLTIPAKVTLQGQGREATTILCDASMGAVNTIFTSGNSQGLRDLKIDENYPNRAGGSPFVGIFMNGTYAVVENCLFTRNKSNGSFIYLATGGQMRNCVIQNTGGGLGTAMVQGGELIDNCELTLNQNNGSVLDFMQSPGRVCNCRLVRTIGSLGGAAIRLQSSQQSAVGNMISVSSGNKAIIISTGTTACVAVGNVSNGATILLELNANSAIVVGNSLVVVTNNSGTGTNQIANNS